MSLVSVKVSLYRDGGGTAWGFRLQGGTDVQLPLTVQRVVFGSPADGELLQGDIITQIGNKDATRLTHHQAHNTIKGAGNNLSLTVQRPGRYTSQVRKSNSNTYSYGIPNLVRSDYNGDSRRFVPQPPQNFPATLNSDVQTEKDFERQCIACQPHRTFPLITPSVKVKHDVPTGSYLRYCNDPFTRNRPEASMKAKVQESIINAAGGWSAGSSPARSGTPEVVGNVGPNSHIVHRQYNSPIHLYSPQNIADTISSQTGVTPTLGDFIKEAIVEIASPTDDSTLKRGPGDIRLYDINKSPTYQAICEKEWRSVKTSNAVSEHNPVQNKTKVRSPVPPTQQHFQHHHQVHHHDYYNHMGIPKDKILQSKSFELINTVLAGETDF